MFHFHNPILAYLVNIEGDIAILLLHMQKNIVIILFYVL